MENGSLDLRIEESGKPTHARIQLQDADGEYRYPRGGVPYKKDLHFTIYGGFSIHLPRGIAHILIEKGKEYEGISDTIEISEGEVTTRLFEMRRWIDMAKLGWYSGDTHVHRNPRRMPHLLEAEDLNVAPVISYWNQEWQFEGLLFQGDIWQRGKRSYSFMTQEDERSGGAAMGINICNPVKVATGNWHPAQNLLLRRMKERGAIIEQEKPFWWEAPVNVALGLVDTMGVVNNHLQRREVRDDEAWGRPRDRDRYPGTRGFLDYVLDLYYRYLNLGMRIPISAGSASGVMLNPVGFNRLYVKMEGEDFNYGSWCQAMKEGRGFATNGPMLFTCISGEGPGIRLRPIKTREVQIEIKVISGHKLRTVDLVRNGSVDDSWDAQDERTFEQIIDLEIEESCWLAVRAFEARNDTIFAHSNPFFLQTESPMNPSPEDAEFYLNWCRELLERSIQDDRRYGDEKERVEVQESYRRAMNIYANILQNSSDNKS